MIKYYNDYSYVLKEYDENGVCKKNIEFVSDAEAYEYLKENNYE